MYKINVTKQEITDHIELNNNGTVEVIPVNLIVDDVIGKYADIQQTIADAQKAADVKTLDKAIADLFLLVFGDDGARRIVEIYENRLYDMLADIFPYIKHEIEPKLKAAMGAKKARYEQIARGL